MGAIQGAINQAIGATAAAVNIGKKVKMEKEATKALSGANEEKAIELEAANTELDTAINEDSDKIKFHLEDNPELSAVDLDQRLAIEEAAGNEQNPDSLAKAKEALDRMTNAREAKITLRKLNAQRIEALRGGRK